MINVKNFLKPLSVAAVALTLAACGADVTVKASLQGTKDITDGQKVYLDNQPVGEIVDVDRHDGKTLVEIELDANGVNSVMNDAAIVVNRLKEGSPVEIHNRQGSTEPIVDGQEIEGLDSMFQLGAWMVGDKVNLGAGAISDYVSAFQKYLQGEDWQTDREQVTRQVTEQAKEAAKAAELAVKDVSQEMSKVVEEIKKAEEPMAQAVEQLGSDLAPVIGELGKSGQSIMRELEKLTNNLDKQVNEGDREVGSRFFESLNKTLETINESLEDSLETSNKSNFSSSELSSTEKSVQAEQPSVSVKEQLKVKSEVKPTADIKSTDVVSEKPKMSDESARKPNVELKMDMPEKLKGLKEELEKELDEVIEKNEKLNL